ncbi:MAG: hydroxysqualene dehydroxylase HpnE [Calditrichia bacterium]
MNKEIIIIGGGLAGISAAIHAIQHGFRPIILEKNRELGGRVRSVYANDIHQTIDNGQHILSAAYDETIRMLKQTGSLHKVYFQKNFNIHFIKSQRRHFVFRTFALPSPLHFFIPLMLQKKFTGTNTAEYISFVRKNIGLKEAELRKMTVSQWLSFTGQSKNLRTLLWEPLTHSILNASMEEASAYLLQQAVNQSFLHSRKRAALGIPRDWLGNIFVTPAEKFISDKGGSIHRLCSLHKFISENGHINSIVTRKQQFYSPWIISTVPPYALKSVLEESQIQSLNRLTEKCGRFSYNPIITINIFLRAPINVQFPVAPVASPLQWIFPHPSQNSGKAGYGYALVISAANQWTIKNADQIIDMVKGELFRILGINLNNNHKLIKYKIIKEKRATVSQTPEFLKLRPAVETPIDNFFLAGDWVATGLPATIESAVKSGRMAVEAVVKKASSLDLQTKT